jgi:hypothetical protein
MEFDDHVNRLLERRDPLRAARQNMHTKLEEHPRSGTIHPEVIAAEINAAKEVGGFTLELVRISVEHPVQTVRAFGELRKYVKSQER